MKVSELNFFYSKTFWTAELEPVKMERLHNNGHGDVRVRIFLEFVLSVTFGA